MIDVYSWATPNGHKIHIMLEECNLPYRLHPINIGADEQFEAGVFKISPNNKIPAIVDSDGPEGQSISIFESGAILIYLAEKTGRFMLQGQPSGRYDVLQWLMFQMSSVGPMFGQATHFFKYASEKVPYAIERYSKEVQRLCQVMDKRLMASAYIAGGQYSIADIAIFPWLSVLQELDIKLDDFPYLKSWFDSIKIRPAIKKGLNIFAG